MNGLLLLGIVLFIYAGFIIFVTFSTIGSSSGNMVDDQINK